MESEHRRIELRFTVDGGHEIAATLHLPDRVHPRAPLIVGLPGGGYGRGYFDLPKAGYSQAAHHAGRGMLTVAFDHLGTGDSSVPPMSETTIEAVAAVGHQALTAFLTKLRAGSIAVDVPPVAPAAVIGCGQSMGGHVAVAMQTFHRSFDAVAALGTGMVRTNTPLPPGTPPLDIPDGIDAAALGALLTAQIDWRWLCHWEHADAADLIDEDMVHGFPRHSTAPTWGSVPFPGFAPSLAMPGAVLPMTERIDVPVLIGMGERDVTSAPAEELTAFPASPDIAAIRVSEMAHMHNFAPTRAVMWRRIDAFVGQVAADFVPSP